MSTSNLQPFYLGVDVAGTKNTWMAALTADNGNLNLITQPHKAKLKDIVDYCEKNDVIAAAIDAQLTIAVSEDNGFRNSDKELRAQLPKDCRNWVASINSLSAVPIRGRLLADSLSPTVGTILETHPQASLYFGLGYDEPIKTALKNYKKGPNTDKHISTLWQAWSTHFNITSNEVFRDDGALDAVVCATVAYSFHHQPEKLHRLRHKAPDKTGRGPFYVLKVE